MKSHYDKKRGWYAVLDQEGNCAASFTQRQRDYLEQILDLEGYTLLKLTQPGRGIKNLEKGLNLYKVFIEEERCTCKLVDSLKEYETHCKLTVGKVKSVGSGLEASRFLWAKDPEEALLLATNEKVVSKSTPRKTIAQKAEEEGFTKEQIDKILKIISK